MTNSEDKDSLNEMLAKIPITETKGSLLSAIAKLLRVIDVSGNSIMIPTLLKDKCEFDAYEMLILAKILKASILGHNDLVEFYMSESSSQLNSLVQQHHQANKQLLNINSNNHQQPQITHHSQLTSAQTNYITQSNQFNGHHHQSYQTHFPSYHNPYNHLQLNSATPSLRSSAGSTSTTSSPSTPLPQAESIGALSPLKLSSNGDPDTTVRLLLQIEQLKLFIPQVTGLFENIIELYKDSVDTITKLTN